MAREKDTRGLGLRFTDSPPPVGKSWFFGIGINTYQAPLPCLHNARKDIEDLLLLLQERYELDEVLTLFDEAATRNAVMDQLQHLDEQVGPHDKLIIYYSGHGHLDQKDRGYWIPADAEERRTGTYLHHTTVREYIAGIDARHTLLISDSCFSGALLRDPGHAQAALEELERDRSRWVISSGRQQEKVGDGKPGQNSPFAAGILKVLRQNQGALNAGLLYDQVLKLTRFNYEQTPQSAPLFGAGHQGGQYVFRLRAGEDSLWQSAAAVNTIRSLNAYLTQFPHGKYADEALARMLALEDEQEWQKAGRIDLIFAYLSYLRKFPKPLHVEAARKRIAELEAEDSAARPEPLTSPQPPKVKQAVAGPAPNTFTDPRDGQTYRTIELNGLRWMAKNLNYELKEGSWQYDNDPKNGAKYGRLYTWEAAQKACPPGWRLPTDEEWRALAMSQGGLRDDGDKEDPKKAYAALIEGGSSVFSALLGGYRYSDGSFRYLGGNGYYWCATESSGSRAWNYFFYRYYGKLYRSNYNKALGFSCRCVQD